MARVTLTVKDPQRSRVLSALDARRQSAGMAMGFGVRLQGDEQIPRLLGGLPVSNHLASSDWVPMVMVAFLLALRMKSTPVSGGAGSGWVCQTLDLR